MTSRTRPRLGTSHRHHRRGSIGVVARSTIGFGRIIASAGSTRPKVTTDSLTTNSLRPPLGAWTHFAADEPEPMAELSWTTRAATPLRRAAAAPAPARTAPKPRPTQGEKKVDSLRRLLEQRGMLEAVPVPEPAAAGQPSIETPEVPAAEIGDRSATTAGPTTAPGQLARRSRPELTTAEDRLSVVFPEGAPSARANQRSSGGGMDGFRQALAAKGLMDAPSEVTTDRGRPARRSPEPRETPRREPRPPRSRPAAPQQSGPATPAATPGTRSSAPAAPSTRTTPSAPSSPSSDASQATAPTRPAGGEHAAPGATSDGASTAGGTVVQRSFYDDIARLATPLPFSLLPEQQPFRQRTPIIDTSRHAPVNPGVSVGVDAPDLGVGTTATMSPPLGLSRADDRNRDATGVSSAPAAAARSISAPSPSLTAAAPGTRPPANDAGAPGTVQRRPSGVSPAVEPNGVVAPSPANSRPTPSPATRQHLRDVGHRTGIQHSRSLVNRPLTELSARLQRAAIPESSWSDHSSSPVIQRATRAPQAPAATPRASERATVTAATPSVATPITPAATTPTPAATPDFIPASASASNRRSETPLLRRPGTVIADLRRSPDFIDVPSDRTATLAPAPTAAGPTAGALQRALAAMTAAAPAQFSGHVAANPDHSVTQRRTPSSPTTNRLAPAPMSGVTAVARTNAPGERPASPDQAAPSISRRPVAQTQDLTARVQRAVDERLTAGMPLPLALRGQDGPPGTDTDSRTSAPDIAQLATTPPPRMPAPQTALADRFLQELGREPATSSRALPTPFQPLASAITGAASRVRISTDGVTRRALAAVGKRAATIGDVIHLQRAPEHDMRGHEVIAHELTHVAHPSPIPRFFDDDHRGPEERMAEQVAKVIARAPVMPSSSAPSSRAGHSSPDTIRRSTAPSSSTASPGTISAADLAASFGGGSGASGGSGRSGSSRSAGSSGGATIQRSTSATSSTDSSPSIQRSIQRSLDGDEVEPSESGSPFGNERAEREWFERMVSKSIEEIVRRVEDRVIIDLERRGGRNWRNL